MYHQVNLCFYFQSRGMKGYPSATHLGTKRFSSLIFSPAFIIPSIFKAFM